MKQTSMPNTAQPTSNNPRWYPRRRLAEPVTIELDDGPGTRLYATTLNFGLGGICVRLSASFLYPNALVRVHFARLRTHARGTRRFPAIVVWASGNFAGLVFDDFDVEALRARWNLMLNHRRMRRRDSTGATRRPA